MTSGERIADIRIDEAGKLVVVALDGKPLNPAKIMTRGGIAKDGPTHPDRIAVKRAELATEERERELLERLKILSAPTAMPAVPLTSMVETEAPPPVVEETLPTDDEEARLKAQRARMQTASARNAELRDVATEERRTKIRTALNGNPRLTNKMLVTNLGIPLGTLKHDLTDMGLLRRQRLPSKKAHK